MFSQSTLISYHTEAFVKTEVGCTVHTCMNSLVSFQMRTLGVHFCTSWMITKMDSAFLQIWIVPSIVLDFDCDKFTTGGVYNLCCSCPLTLFLLFVIKAALFVVLF